MTQMEPAELERAEYWDLVCSRQSRITYTHSRHVGMEDV